MFSSPVAAANKVAGGRKICWANVTSSATESSVTSTAITWLSRPREVGGFFKLILDTTTRAFIQAYGGWWTRANISNAGTSAQLVQADRLGAKYASSGPICAVGVALRLKNRARTCRCWRRCGRGRSGADRVEIAGRIRIERAAGEVADRSLSASRVVLPTDAPVNNVTR